MQHLFSLFTFFLITTGIVEGVDTKNIGNSRFWSNFGSQYNTDLWKAVNELKQQITDHQQNLVAQQEEIAALREKDTEQQQKLEMQQENIVVQQEEIAALREKDTEQQQKLEMQQQSIIEQEQKLNAQQKVVSEFPTFCEGRTNYKQWVSYEHPFTIKVVVDTSHCQFQTVPKYFTSLSGIGNHWMTMGATSIYGETVNGFTVFLHVPNELYTSNMLALARMPTYQWELNWIGVILKN